MMARMTATYTGRDADNLVTAVIDTDGLVERIQFGTTALSRPPDVLERAVLDAVGAAYGQGAAVAAERAAQAKADLEIAELERAQAQRELQAILARGDHRG
jgi:DNA-binding protein YbaB